jgi:septal ring factor EnvC (AmiA/AmiB activator)
LGINNSRFDRNSKVNLNAGADLLHRYQTQWQQMHQLNEENARIASDIAKGINDIDMSSKRQHLLMSELLSQLSSLPQIKGTIDSIEKDLNKTKKQIIQIEEILTTLEEKKEEEDFEKLKLDHQYKCAVYKETKASQFETIKVKLALEHSHKVQEFEKHQQNILKERQEAFQAAFEDQLNLYKTQGKIDRKESFKEDNNQKRASIEEIVIETEKSEEVALEEFLEDVP